MRLYCKDMSNKRNRKIWQGISSRFMYGRLPQPLRQAIFRALEENGGQLSDGVEKAVLYDMEFVTA